jgi:light-independent protochlorophyllide reductase subunit B
VHRRADPGRPGGLAKALGLPVPVVALELPAYQRKENWGAAETFYQLVRALAGPAPRRRRPRRARRGAAPALQPAGRHGAGLSPPRRPARDQRLLGAWAST